MRKYLPLIFCFLAILFFAACDKKPQDSRAVLSINSMPEGASVFISGKDCGKTPVKIKLAPGYRLIKLEKSGYESVWKGISLASGKKEEMNLRMKEITSSILLKTSADVVDRKSGQKKTAQIPAEIFFDGKKYGQTPLVIRDLKAGVYSASLKAPGYAQTEVQWTIDSKRPQMKIVKLTSNTGIVQVTGGPEKAVVTINGTIYGNTPCEIPLEQGEYSVEVSAPGYQSYIRDISLNSNSKVVVKPVLTELPATLDIKSVPSGASVTIDGKPCGTAPLTMKGVKAGKFKIEFSLKGFDTDVQEVGVAPGQNLIVTGHLVSNLGGIQFVTEPAGVTVYLNNKVIGVTEADPAHKGVSKVFQINGLKPGNHVLTFYHKMATPSRRVLDVVVEKNKIKRLEQNVELWIANARIVHKIGSVYVGRIVSENDDYINFEQKPGLIIDYKRSELKHIERFPGRE